MALPAIQPYALPNIEELPVNRVNWIPDPCRATLLIHDMQNHFFRAFPPNSSLINTVVANINRLRTACFACDIPVIYSAQPGGQSLEQRGLLQDFWGAGISSDPQHAAIIAPLTPSANEQVLTKWRYSAFQRTDLLHTLRTSGRDQLIICGIYAHIGCLMTACEAYMNEIQPFLLADAVADFSRADHDMALRYAAELCAVVATTKDMINQLGQTSTPGQTSLYSLDQLRRDVAVLIDEQPAQIADDDNLIYLGLDSIRLMSLIERWRQMGIDVSFVELAEQPTLQGLWNLLASRMPALLTA